MLKPNSSQNLAARPRAGLFSVLILLAGWLAVVTPLHAQNPPTYLFQIDSSVVPGGFLPYFVALDSSKNVYVADRANDRVEKFDRGGNYLTQWGSHGSGNGQFAEPEGIAVDSSNNVYVADLRNDRIEKFTSSGTYLAQWGSLGTSNGQFQEPFGIAVDSSNNVYVADIFNYRVEKFTSSGTYLAQWGSLGTNNGQFEDPADIAVDSSGNFIYVADSYNYRIQVFVNNANIVPPIITSQPVSQLFSVGANVTLSVGVVGTPPFSYQWNSNNVAVPGATNATFLLTNVNTSDSGSYSVLVTNSFGSELSGDAVLFLPAVAITQPASGISSTGAVLNGSVRLGSDETLAWFDWGTDDNYGNITGASIVPGNKGSNSISATLSGLPGNVYHYRMDAANDFGIVYGDDQSFTVGFAPSATTLPPTNGADGATLEAAVNPEGWDTTVYFQWETPTLTNTTPGINIGAGAASLNVSSFVPGLASSTPYQYQVVASNALGTAIGAVAYGSPDRLRYLFSGSETDITLPPGTYIITAYGAPGGYEARRGIYGHPGFGAEMSAEFNFSTVTNLTLLVGGHGGYYDGNYGGGGGGGGSFVVEGSTPLVIAGGGGGGGDFHGLAGNGNVSTNGSAGGGGASGYNYSGDGGAGGTGGGGGGVGIGIGMVYGGYGPPDYIYGGGGGGGFLGDGGGDDGVGGGSSFESGGDGGGGGYYGALGGSGGGGGGGEGAPGGGGGYSGGGGGGYYGQNEPGYGGGGGSTIDSSAIAILTEVSGIASPDDSTNGEIIITAVPTPLVITTHAAFGFTNGVFGFNVIGPSGSNVVIQASTDLQTWIPLQTNLLGSGPLYFSDAQSPANPRRFYRAQLSP